MTVASLYPNNQWFIHYRSWVIGISRVRVCKLKIIISLKRRQKPFAIAKRMKCLLFSTHLSGTHMSPSLLMSRKWLLSERIEIHPQLPNHTPKHPDLTHSFDIRHLKSNPPFFINHTPDGTPQRKSLEGKHHPHISMLGWCGMVNELLVLIRHGYTMPMVCLFFLQER